MKDISSVSARAKLKPHREPYWAKIGTRSYLGFRKADKGGTWIVRYYGGYRDGQTYQSLGDLADILPTDQYDKAMELARIWLGQQRGAGPRIKKDITVWEACKEYVIAGASRDQAGRLDRLVGDHYISRVFVRALTVDDVRDWRRHIESLPVVIAKRKDGDVTGGKRSKSTVNRDMVPLRAALNYARDHGYVATDHAWRVALEPYEKADKRRNVYLDRGQRRALVENLQADAAVFVRGLCALPLRPGALAKLSCSDFDARKHELRIAGDKGHADRHILLPKSTSDVLAKCAKGRPADAPLFVRANGKRWDRDAWKGPIKSAAIAAKLPEDAVAYSLRHSAITDLVVSGLDLATVATLSGTSVAMIERHYSHLQKHRAADALAKLAL